jgi:hypothetical protein
MKSGLRLTTFSIIPALIVGCGGAANVQQAALVGTSGSPVLNSNVTGTQSTQITFANDTKSSAQTITDVNNHLDSGGTDWSLLSNKIIGYNDELYAPVLQVDAYAAWRIGSPLYGTSITPELWDHADVWNLTNKGINTRPTDAQIKYTLTTARSAGALTAWSQGWTGEGVTLGYNDGEIVDLPGRDRDYYPAANFLDALQSKAIAPNTTNLSYSNFMSADIIIFSDTVLAFSRTSGTWDQSDRRSYGFNLGVAAGIGALVMQKFPNANDNAVGTQVTASNGSVAQGLTPISGLQ